MLLQELCKGWGVLDIIPTIGGINEKIEFDDAIKLHQIVDKDPQVAVKIVKSMVDKHGAAFYRDVQNILKEHLGIKEWKKIGEDF